MRPIVTDVADVRGLPVCLCAGHGRPAKTDEPIKMPFGC